MISVTAATIAATTVTHAGEWEVQVTPPGGPAVVLPVESGSCEKTSNGDPRTIVDLVTPADLFPSVPDPTVLPFGTTAVLRWRLGPDTYTIASGPVVRSELRRPQDRWTLTVQDLSALVMHDLVAPGEFTWNPTETVAAMVTRLVQRTVAGVPVSASGDATTETVDAEMEPKPEDGAWNPWQLALQATTTSGAECFFDPVGTLVIRDRPDLDTPVDVLTADEHITGHTLRAERAVSRTIIVWLNRDASPPTITRTGIWDDTRPGSPTNQAAIGRVTAARTQDGNPGQVRADKAARRWARRLAGNARTLTIECVPRPWLEPGDTVTVVLADGSSVDHLVSRVRLPLSAEPMTIECVSTRWGTSTPV